MVSPRFTPITFRTWWRGGTTSRRGLSSPPWDAAAGPTAIISTSRSGETEWPTTQSTSSGRENRRPPWSRATSRRRRAAPPPPCARTTPAMSEADPSYDVLEGPAEPLETLLDKEPAELGEAKDSPETAQRNREILSLYLQEIFRV